MPRERGCYRLILTAVSPDGVKTHMLTQTLAPTGAGDHGELEPRPARDLDPALVALHKEITARNAQILYRGTDVKSYNDPRAVGLR